MRQIDLTDLYQTAKLKADLIYLLCRIEKEKLPLDNQFVYDLSTIVYEFIEFESSLQASFIPNTDEK